MLKMRRIYLVFIAIVFIVLFVTPCAAINENLDLETVDKEQADLYYSRLQIEAISESESKNSFSCFAVNNQGDYALGFEGGAFGQKDYVRVYDANSKFLYGFSFLDNGAFAIELEADSFVLYSVRSDLAIHIDSTGNCLETKRFPPNSKNNAIWRKEIDVELKQVDGTTYSVERRNFKLYLIRVTAQNIKTVLVETTDFQTLMGIIGFSFPFLVVLIGGIVVLCVIRRKRREKENRHKEVSFIDNEDA